MNNASTEPPPHISDETNFEERTRRVQLFRAGAFQFGVFEDEVATIADWRAPTPLPHAPESVLGVVSIQGRMLTVLDLALLAGSDSISAGAAYRYIIALRGDEQLALGVSELDETVEHPHPDSHVAAQDNERPGLEVLSRAGSLTKILNVADLFPAALRGRERRRRRF
jgi:chemotaxis signal transduction protein